MEDVEEKGGTGPSCVSGFDVFEVDVAGKRSGGGGGEEGLDLGEIGLSGEVVMWWRNRHRRNQSQKVVVADGGYLMPPSLVW
ncbi:hypothetical protein MTR_1g063420 [Medicago truncatula]|uniref:Uncharacterized protein n=1 Tax=Medicago truncatula TaxID=3880 RepID=A0A072VJI4_MEDTR|nr:hypothetical protein MTR_1g063420 [Medicago truncatula]